MPRGGNVAILAKHSLDIRVAFGPNEWGYADSRALKRGSSEAVARQIFCSCEKIFLQWRGRFFAVARKIFCSGAADLGEGRKEKESLI